MTTTKMPVLFIGYDNFEDNKLFSYEFEGVHILPVFTSMAVANKFLKHARKTLQTYNDKRRLGIVVCPDKDKLVDILTLISLTDFGTQIIINADDLSGNSIPLPDFLSRYQSDLSSFG